MLDSFTHWRSDVLDAIAPLGICLILDTGFIYRRSARTWMVVVALVANLVFLLTATLVGTMAISNTWL